MLATISTDFYNCELSDPGVSEKVNRGDGSSSFRQQGYVAPQTASTELLVAGMVQWQ